MYSTLGDKSNINKKLEENLDKVLQLFCSEVRKKNGDEYEPDSLRTMIGALDRVLKENGCHSVF